MGGDAVKTIERKTIDGKVIKLSVPETPDEEREVQKRMRDGKTSDTHSFSDEHPDRVED